MAGQLCTAALVSATTQASLELKKQGLRKGRLTAACACCAQSDQCWSPTAGPPVNAGAPLSVSGYLTSLSHCAVCTGLPVLVEHRLPLWRLWLNGSHRVRATRGSREGAVGGRQAASGGQADQRQHCARAAG